MLQELHKISRLDANVSVKENMINIVLQDSLKNLINLGSVLPNRC